MVMVAVAAMVAARAAGHRGALGATGRGRGRGRAGADAATGRRRGRGRAAATRSSLVLIMRSYQISGTARHRRDVLP